MTVFPAAVSLDPDTLLIGEVIRTLVRRSWCHGTLTDSDCDDLLLAMIVAKHTQ